MEGKAKKNSRLFMSVVEDMPLEKVQENLTRLELSKSTNEFSEFVYFMVLAKKVDETINGISDFFFIQLSDLASDIFKDDYENFMIGFNKTLNKRDYLKVHYENKYIEPEILAKWKIISNNQRKNLEVLGYLHGLNQIDFCLFDLIEPFRNRNRSLGLFSIGLEYYNNSIFDNSKLYPTSSKDFIETYNKYLYNFKIIALGYAQFLFATELQKMLKDLEDNKINDLNRAENLKEPKVDNSNSLTKKITWNGANNQLYDVIRQLKKKDLIANSYLEIASFICLNFEGFETNFSTVLKEIQKDERPTKNKRINLDLSELPEIDKTLPQ